MTNNQQTMEERFEKRFGELFWIEEWRSKEKYTPKKVKKILSFIRQEKKKSYKQGVEEEKRKIIKGVQDYLVLLRKKLAQDKKYYKAKYVLDDLEHYFILVSEANVEDKKIIRKATEKENYIKVDPKELVPTYKP